MSLCCVMDVCVRDVSIRHVCVRDVSIKDVCLRYVSLVLHNIYIARQ